jgi:hypothetical protein
MNKNAVTSVQPKSSSIPDINKEEEKQEQLLQRKISLATEGFATIKYHDTHLVKLELLSNATTIDNALHYIRERVNLTIVMVWNHFLVVNCCVFSFNDFLSYSLLNN